LVVAEYEGEGRIVGELEVDLVVEIW